MKQYDDTYMYNKNFIAVKLNNKWGLINGFDDGNEICPIKYDEITEFHNGILSVELNNKWGFLNTKGEEICPIKYDYVGTFLTSEFAAVNLNNKWGIINKKGEEICYIKYDNLICDYFGLEFAKVKLNHKWGFLNTQGEEITPIKYDRPVYSCKNGFYLITCGNKLGFIDKEGKEYFFDNYIDNIGSRGDTLYYTNYKDTYVFRTGCFLGNLDNFVSSIKETHEYNYYAQQYIEVIKNLK